MKRIHLFEFEDLPWFPSGLRKLMTRYLIAIHRVMGTSDSIAEIIARGLRHSKENRIVDLCSGSGGPMPEVKKILEEKHGFGELHLFMTDLYPDSEAAKKFNAAGDESTYYSPEPVNAMKVEEHLDGFRTMLCSLHHMKPEIAKGILKAAKDDRQAICVFEISDNSVPLIFAWIAIPIGFLMTLFITPFVRPLSWKQILLTYFIPILPLVIGWDGGVSNMRTYSMEDMDELLEGLHADDYKWEKGSIKGKGGNQLYLLGWPA